MELKVMRKSLESIIARGLGQTRTHMDLSLYQKCFGLVLLLHEKKT